MSLQVAPLSDAWRDAFSGHPVFLPLSPDLPLLPLSPTLLSGRWTSIPV
jgi:hypothetical protein